MVSEATEVRGRLSFFALLVLFSYGNKQSKQWEEK